MPSMTIKRANSSPNVGGLAIGELGPSSPADKKRNKLGYHRTAVACSEYLCVRFLGGTLAYWTRSLSKAQNQMHSCRRRWEWPMPELHSTEKGLSLLSCGPANPQHGKAYKIQLESGRIRQRAGQIDCFFISRHSGK